VKHVVKRADGGSLEACGFNPSGRSYFILENCRHTAIASFFIFLLVCVPWKPGDVDRMLLLL